MSFVNNRDLWWERVTGALRRQGFKLSRQEDAVNRRFVLAVQWTTDAAPGVTHHHLELVEVPYGTSPSDTVTLVLVQLRLAGCSFTSLHSV